MSVILKNICPDIIHYIEGEVFSKIRTTARKPAILKCLETLNLFDKVCLANEAKKIWISGNPSIGKSTSLEIIKFNCLKVGIQYYFLDLADLNYKKTAKDDYQSLLSAINNTDVDIILLDSYDELKCKKIKFDGSNKEYSIDEIIHNCSKTIVVSSRSNSDTEEVFKYHKFHKVELQELDEDKVRRFVEFFCHEDDLVITQEFLNILKNTMYLVLFISEESKQTRRNLALSKTPAKFLYSCLSKMYLSKSQMQDDQERALERLENDLCKIGEHFVTKEYFDKEIPYELKTIFQKNEDGRILFLHQDYRDLAGGMYLAKKIYINPYGADVVLQRIKIDNFEDRRILLFAGECLRFFDENDNKQTFAILDKSVPKNTSLTYCYLLHIFAGYNHSTIDGNSTNFVLGNSFVKAIKKHGFYGKNKLLDVNVSARNLNGRNLIHIQNVHGNIFLEERTRENQGGFKYVMDILCGKSSKTKSMLDELPEVSNYKSYEKTKDSLESIEEFFVTMFMMPLSAIVAGIIVFVWAFLDSPIWLLNCGKAISSVIEKSISVEIFSNILVSSALGILILLLFFAILILAITFCLSINMVFVIVKTLIISIKAKRASTEIANSFGFDLLYGSDGFFKTEIYFLRQDYMQIEKEIDEYQSVITKKVGFSIESVSDYSLQMAEIAYNNQEFRTSYIYHRINAEYWIDFENKCMDIIEDIVASNFKMNREDAVSKTQELLESAINNGDSKTQELLKRVLREFKEASDHDYKQLHDVIFN